MKMSTLKLLVPIVAITVQSNSASTIIPPFLHDLRIPMAAIGSLISLGPILALTSRLPVGMAYQRDRARLLISIAVLAMGITNYFYSLAQDILVFAIVHALNGFAYGAVTTVYMAFYVDSLAPDENRNHAMGYYVGTLASGVFDGKFFRRPHGGSFRLRADVPGRRAFIVGAGGTAVVFAPAGRPKNRPHEGEVQGKAYGG